MKSEYCLICTHRVKGQLMNSDGDVIKSAVTNKGGFCFIGYRQNPNTARATFNAMLNGTEVCRSNPWRGFFMGRDLEKFDKRLLEKLLARGERVERERGN